MGMDDAVHFVPRAVDGAVDDEPGLVDVVLGRVEQDLAVEVELDEARGVHLIVEQAVGIDEEGVVIARDAGRDVVGDHLVHAVEMDEAVRRGEVDALRPFLRADLLADGFLLLDAGDAHDVFLARGPMPRSLTPTTRSRVYAFVCRKSYLSGHRKIRELGPEGI